MTINLTPDFDIYKKITKLVETPDGWLDITLECGHEFQVITNASLEVGSKAPCSQCLGEYISQRRKIAEKAGMN